MIFRGGFGSVWGHGMKPFTNCQKSMQVWTAVGFLILGGIPTEPLSHMSLSKGRHTIPGRSCRDRSNECDLIILGPSSIDSISMDSPQSSIIPNNNANDPMLQQPKATRFDSTCPKPTLARACPLASVCSVHVHEPKNPNAYYCFFFIIIIIIVIIMMMIIFSCKMERTSDDVNLHVLMHDTIFGGEKLTFGKLKDIPGSWVQSQMSCLQRLCTMPSSAEYPTNYRSPTPTLCFPRTPSPSLQRSISPFHPFP